MKSFFPPATNCRKGGRRADRIKKSRRDRFCTDPGAFIGTKGCMWSEENLQPAFQLTIERFFFDMPLMIDLRLSASHPTIKCLTFNGGMGGNVQLAGAVFSGPVFRRQEERRADPAAAHVFRDVDARQVEIVLFPPKRPDSTQTKPFRTPSRNAAYTKPPVEAVFFRQVTSV